MKDNHVAILLEDIQSQFKVFGEGLSAVREDVGAIKTQLNNTNEVLLETRFLVKDMQMDINELKIGQKQTNQRLTRIEHTVAQHGRKLTTTGPK
ncbi:MAG: hypothetical protein WC838_01000 [Candidatus Margulisiibacteriota bacterium]|jgi:hypothetical protein